MESLKPGVGPPVPMDLPPEDPPSESDGPPPRGNVIKVLAALLVAVLTVGFLATFFAPALLTSTEDPATDGDAPADVEPDVGQDPGPAPPEPDPPPAGEPPKATFSVICDGLSCAFDASESEAAGGIGSYEWTLGDGTRETGPTLTHDYAAPGTYTVTLTVTDSEGQEAKDDTEIVVEDAPPETFEHEGEGPGTSEPFDTRYDLLRIEYEHDGDGPFEVRLVGDGGTGSILLVAQDGDVSGSRYHAAPPGTYRLEVDADDDWEVRIEQPRPESGDEVPYGTDGDGDTATGFLRLEEGTYEIELEARGFGDLSAGLYYEDGEHIPLAEMRGGERETLILEVRTAGYYAFDVAAEREWRIEVEEG